MAGAGLQLHAGDLEQFITRAINLGQNPEGAIRRIGSVVVAQTKRRFHNKSHRRTPWADKPPIFVIWEGGKDKPLLYKNRLMQSIVQDTRGRGPNMVLRVGSALPYAATHQFGDDRPRAFYVFIVPKMEQGVHKKRIMRDERTGYPLGKMTLGQSDGAGGRVAPDNAVKVLVRLNGIKPRPFLAVPNALEEREILNVLQRYFLRRTGLQPGKSGFKDLDTDNIGGARA